MAEDVYPRLAIVRHWSTMNDHLIELVDLIPDEKLDWSPREGEWGLRLVLQHLILARYHGPIMDGHDDGAEMSAAVADTRTKEGIKKQLRHSWGILAEFLSDAKRLDAQCEPNARGFYQLEPEIYDGHYVAYHRLAHDLHHRSTVLDYLGQLGISLEGLIRPL